MSRQLPTLIGRVTSVYGAIVTVRLEDDLAGISPIWNGQLHTVGQLGTTVSLPQGTSTLLGVVTRLSLGGAGPTTQITDLGESDSRSIEVQLTGEIDALGNFHRGVANHPGIDDPVHFVSGEDLVAIYPRPSDTHLSLGRLSSNRSIDVSVDLAKLVVRHSAVVGSTGAGKSSAVAALLQQVESGPWHSANAIVVDTHGEYASALTDGTAKLILAEATSSVLPAWVLPANDILEVYLGGTASSAVRLKFALLVTDARRRFAMSAKWLAVDAEEINADTPVPFDLHEVWLELDSANRRTTVDQGKTVGALDTPGDAKTLKSAIFVPYGPKATEPFKGPENGDFGTYPDQLRRAILEPKLAFLSAGNLKEALKVDPLPAVVKRLVGDDKPISLIDVSGIATDVANVVVGSLLSLIFELALRGGDEGIGRQNPVLLVIEEAHRYFTERPSARLARTYVERISREGRKYGVGLMLVTQRPSEIPKTALSQMGTILALRLNNDSDQATVSSTLPDGIAGIAGSLPGLRTGEALIAGEALPVPSRVMFNAPSPWPKGTDPSLSPWTKTPKTLDLAPAINRWRSNT